MTRERGTASTSPVVAPPAGVVLRCAPDGGRLEVVRDHLGCGDRRAGSTNFVGWVDGGSADKAARFVAAIVADGAAYNWEMNLACGGRLTTCRFAGVRLGDGLLVVGAPFDDAEAGRYADIAEVVNELAALQRDLAKTNAALREEVQRRERAEAQLREANRSLEDQVAQRSAELTAFVYAVSHELKTPLVTIAGYGGSLERDLQRRNVAGMAESIAEIRAAAADLKRHINDLLVVSQTGRDTAQTEPIRLTGMLDEIAGERSEALTALGARLVVDPQLPTLRADRKALRRVFENLVDNALRYRRPDTAPRVEIGARRSDRELQLYVRDNGVGIKPEYRERIFGLFQRADRRAEGTGVGLAISKRVIEAHGGRIWVESEPGRGSTFWIGFPADIIVPAAVKGA